MREPNREELKAWFEKNAPRFTVAGRASFRHVYFSFDKRGEQAREVAEVRSPRSPASRLIAPSAATLADPFMFQDYYGDRSPEQVANVFGAKFTRSLFQLEPGPGRGRSNLGSAGI